MTDLDAYNKIKNLVDKSISRAYKYGFVGGLITGGLITMIILKIVGIL